MRLSPAICATLGTLLLVPLLSGCSLLFVHGPAPGWQDASAEDLTTMALTTPCTTSRGVLFLDAFGALITGSFAAVFISTGELTDGQGVEMGLWETYGPVIYPVALGVGAIMGNQKVNDCRALYDRLIVLRAGNAVGQATYNWLDEFSPAPDFGADPPDLPVAIPSLRWFDQLFPAFDFGATAFDPVFGGVISNSQGH